MKFIYLYLLIKINADRYKNYISLKVLSNFFLIPLKKVTIPLKAGSYLYIIVSRIAHERKKMNQKP